MGHVLASRGGVARARRARAAAALAVVAFAIGAILGSGHHTSPAGALAERFVRAWSRSDWVSMYGDIDAARRATLPASRFAAVYREAANTATATRMSIAGRPKSLGGGTVEVQVEIETRLFGTLRSSFVIPTKEDREGLRVHWTRALEFPGLRAGETLTRHTELPPRAALLARDGSPLADGQALGAGTRSSPLGEAARAVVGEVGPVPASRREALERQGVPGDATVGTSGLELALDSRLRGRPGGELLAGSRVLAKAAPRQARAVRTTVSPAIQRAAAAALAGRYGGVVALDPSTGALMAVAGIGMDALQPPGSTFKMVTVTGVLEAKLARTRSTFPFQTYTTLDGVKLENANGESCGGTLAEAFATSCNSVFAPLGVRLGAKRLLATAELFGFDRDPGVRGAAESTLPPADEIQGELELGATAIGQGQVQASALQMAVVAATIADRGRRPRPSFTNDGPAPQPAVDPAVARTVRRLMVGVVRSGTGTAAAIPGVTVAGKTGTAELGSPRCVGSRQTEGQNEGSDEGEHAEGSEGGSGETGDCGEAVKDPHNTDAWFAAFAPALDPKVAVGVLLVRDGAGGDTAAPVAREVLEAALR